MHALTELSQLILLIPRDQIRLEHTTIIDDDGVHASLYWVAMQQHNAVSETKK